MKRFTVRFVGVAAFLFVSSGNSYSMGQQLRELVPSSEDVTNALEAAYGSRIDMADDANNLKQRLEEAIEKDSIESLNELLRKNLPGRLKVFALKKAAEKKRARMIEALLNSGVFGDGCKEAFEWAARTWIEGVKILSARVSLGAKKEIFEKVLRRITGRVLHDLPRKAKELSSEHDKTEHDKKVLQVLLNLGLAQDKVFRQQMLIGRKGLCDLHVIEAFVNAGVDLEPLLKTCEDLQAHAPTVHSSHDHLLVSFMALGAFVGAGIDFDSFIGGAGYLYDRASPGEIVYQLPLVSTREFIKLCQSEEAKRYQREKTQGMPCIAELFEDREFRAFLANPPKYTQGDQKEKIGSMPVLNELYEQLLGLDACRNDLAKLLEYVQDIPKITDGQTSLHWAVLLNRIDTVAAILSWNPSLDFITKSDNLGYSALTYAAALGYETLVIMLIKAYAKHGLKIVIESVICSAKCAAEHGHEDLALNLIAKLPVNNP